LRGSRKRNLTRLGKKSPDGRRENIESERDEQRGSLSEIEIPSAHKGRRKERSKKEKRKKQEKEKILELRNKTMQINRGNHQSFNNHREIPDI
jgi:hypothetical protein